MSDTLDKDWSAIASKVLACIMIDPGAIHVVLDKIGRSAKHFPPKDRPIWRAALACYDNNTPPLIDLVTVRLNGKGGAAQVIASQFTEADNENLIHLANQLADLGYIAQIRNVGQSLSKAVPDDVNRIVKDAKLTIDQPRVQSMRDPSLSAIDEGVWDQIKNRTIIKIPSGFPWFDNRYGGFWSGRNYWFVGPYKSGKTTATRNIAIHAARQGFPMSYFCEGTRDSFLLDLQAMLATEYLILHHKFRLSDLRLSGTFIIWAFQEDIALKPEEIEALEYARSETEGMPLYLYDSKDKVRNLETLHHTLKYDRLERGIQAFIIDYSQLYGDHRADVVQRQATIALAQQSWATSLDLVSIIISQQNEQAINRKSDRHSPGVKGGGDAPAAADGLFICSVDDPGEHQNNAHLNVELKLGRDMGRHKNIHLINKTSGLIVDEFFLRPNQAAPHVEVQEFEF